MISFSRKGAGFEEMQGRTMLPPHSRAPLALTNC
jgi:hypothetical protein